MAHDFDERDDQQSEEESDNSKGVLILLLAMAFAFGVFCGARWYASSFVYQALNNVVRSFPVKTRIPLSFP